MISPIKRIRAVLFDWDGTLVNSLDVKIHNAGGLFHQEFGFSTQEVEDAYRHHSGIPRRQLFDAIMQDLGKPPLQEEFFNHLSMKFSELNTRALSNPALPGLIPPSTPVLLKYLQEKGCFLYVSSSASSVELKEIASALGISVKTVEYHKKHIMDLLDIHTVAQLTRYAISKHIVSLE